MSTLIVQNISDGSSSATPTELINGSTKAWVNFNGTGTVSIRDSLGVSSITDNSTGNYNTNFSTAFTTVGYAFSYGQAEAGGANAIAEGDSSSLTTTTQRAIFVTTNTRAVIDVTYVGGIFIGDQ